MHMNSMRKAGISVDLIYLMHLSISWEATQMFCFGPKNMCNQVQKQQQLQGSNGASAIEYLHWLSLNDSLMFVLHIVDEEKRVQHVFWSDGQSQMDFEVFGDVLAFSAMYSKNKYKCSVVLFSRVNNHNQTIIFAAGFIANEVEETYVWLLKQFSNVMKRKSPDVVVIDGDMTMRNAIRRVFTIAHHQLCVWHLMHNVTSNVASTTFLKSFEACMFVDYSIREFK